MRPTNVEELYLLAGIAPPDIRRDVCARVEKKKQETNAAHSLHGQVPAERRLKRECFLMLRTTCWLPCKSHPLQWMATPAELVTIQLRCQPWWKFSKGAYQSLGSVEMSQQVTHWCSMQQRKRWKYFNGDTTCECGQAPETTKHMLQCPLLAHPCTLDDLQKFNENARKCVDKWKNAVWWHERRRRLPYDVGIK